MKDADGQERAYPLIERDNFVDGELIEDCDTIRMVCGAIGCDDEPCDRCGDEWEPIVAILMLEGSEKAWLLCGACVRDLPREGVVV
ncbi:MAG TPA: hypothetical protein VJ718_10900 [Candidatus Binataceae bacterium]|nr:hypothetical protein [Candidatus Binataceae bacterium]